MLSFCVGTFSKALQSSQYCKEIICTIAVLLFYLFPDINALLPFLWYCKNIFTFMFRSLLVWQLTVSYIRCYSVVVLWHYLWIFVLRKLTALHFNVPFILNSKYSMRYFSYANYVLHLEILFFISWANILAVKCISVHVNLIIFWWNVSLVQFVASKNGLYWPLPDSLAWSVCILVLSSALLYFCWQRRTC